MDKTVLLTGGAGYVGSHANKYLTGCGYKTVVLDNLERGHKEFVKWGEFVEGDIGDLVIRDEIFQRYSFDAIIHFAAYAYIDESVERPGKYWRNNVGNTLGLLESSIQYGVKKFVLSSTCATYGVPSHIPILESHNQHPVNPYGAGKLVAEMMLKDFAAAYDMDYFILRYFNAAGADPDGEIGERHVPETHLIPKLLEAIVGNCSESVPIYGTDYPTKDGTCVRDYIHVTDLADAHFRALAYLLANGQSQECNLGVGTGFSVNEVVKSVERVTGHRVKVELTNRRAGDPAILIADPKEANRILKWSPQFRDLDEIVFTAWNWHRKD